MSWQQLSVIAPENITGDISAMLSILGAVSVTYMDAEDQPLYEPKPGETVIWRQTRIIGLFGEESNLDTISSFISNQFAEISAANWQQEILRERVWERTWMEHYQPMKFGDRLWVCPSGQQNRDTDTVCLTLDPGLAFGTGTHPTTSLCLDWLADNNLTDKTVIDYGCGSGILAIAAILLGAKSACAVDIDPQAITATLDNAEKNHVSDKISCYTPDEFPGLQADILLANILAKPLIELAPQITRLIKPEGRLILSGILNDQADSVQQTYCRYLQLSPPARREDWCRLDGRRSG